MCWARTGSTCGTAGARAPGASADLAVASADTAAVGDTVVVTGTVHLDLDLGAGYHCQVIVEDARIEAE